MSQLDIMTSQADQEKRYMVDVILPLAVKGMFTYVVPFHIDQILQPGIRVEVPFGRGKIYSAIVYKVHQDEPTDYTPKPILSVLDSLPIVTETQIKFWLWINDYYMCHIGEVMIAALPAGLKMSSETILMIHPKMNTVDLEELTMHNDEYIIVKALQHQQELTIKQLRSLLPSSNIAAIIKSCLSEKWIVIREELKESYKPKKEDYLRLAEPFQVENGIQKALETLSASAKAQARLLLDYALLSESSVHVSKRVLFQKEQNRSPILKKLIEKGILEKYTVQVSRLSSYEGDIHSGFTLQDAQQRALNEIEQVHKTQNVALLHGVTGSGKTMIYIRLIEHYLTLGKQVLYLLPEIALTTQIVERLQAHFADDIVVYHSRYSSNERVETWQSVMKGTPIILGARSSIFLPFSNLGLVIIDEEHDSSYKQKDPAPRYHGRDAAIYLATLYGAKVLLGSATPSINTYFNTLIGKYGRVELNQRYGEAKLPKIALANLRELKKSGDPNGMFTPDLIQAMKRSLAENKQIILFQNRRGYAPVMSCQSCGDVVSCKYCDVSLTYHQYSSNLRCHYCGYSQPIQRQCNGCGSYEMQIKGFGTEKIEEELHLLLPDVKVGRLDQDTASGKNKLQSIITSFANKEMDILVGTQMVTKGLDFEHVQLVGVLNADQLLFFPDYNAGEKAFQVLSQVSGRAGRKDDSGLVIIQSNQTDHPILGHITMGKYESFIQNELDERKQFEYPPFSRLIQLQVRHKKREIAQEAARFIVQSLTQLRVDGVLGPSTPLISKVKNNFLQNILIKIDKRSSQSQRVKEHIKSTLQLLKQQKGLSAVRVIIDIDPETMY